MALEIFRFQFERNEVYRRFCLKTGVQPESVRCWRDVPAMVTSAFKNLDVTVIPPLDRQVVFHSSGTTEYRPSRHFHSPDTLAVYEASLLGWFAPHLMGATRSARFLLLSPPAADVPHSSLAHMFQTVSRTFGDGPPEFMAQRSPDGSWALRLRELDELTAAMHVENEPWVICGTAFSFVHWCDYLAQRGRSLMFPEGSRVLETGGYKGRSRTVPKVELHEMISHRLGIADENIICEYGMSELSSQAYDRTFHGSAGSRTFHFPPWARAVVISPETRREVEGGETGLLRICDLANVGSVMAVQTEDLAVRRGAGFELLGRATQAEARGCSLLQVSS